MISLRRAPEDLPAALKAIVDYRKSGLSLNHIVGCPLDCGYCVRHLFSNFDMKRPHLVADDQAAVEALVGHWAFRAGQTPIQLLNRATDPFLGGVKQHLFSTLEKLDARALTNPVLVITRWRILPKDVERLEQLQHLKLTILVTWSGIDDRNIEPIDSAIAEESLAVLASFASRTKAILYWRPIISGINDSDEHLNQALRISHCADATVFSGLFYRREIRDYLTGLGVADFYSDVVRRKILPAEIEGRILAAFETRPLFRKTSCGVAFAHGIPDYNAHFCVREICDICPTNQLAICATVHKAPSFEAIQKAATAAGLDASNVTISERAISVRNSSEQQRYFMQHSLGYQVHDEKHPHHHGRHGRADIGWNT